MEFIPLGCLSIVVFYLCMCFYMKIKCLPFLICSLIAKLEVNKRINLSLGGIFYFLFFSTAASQHLKITRWGCLLCCSAFFISRDLKVNASDTICCTCLRFIFFDYVISAHLDDNAGRRAANNYPPDCLSQNGISRSF